MVLRSCIKIALFLSVIISVVYCADWPQLQCDMGRLGRTTDSVAPPYRPRWVWMKETVIRNHLSNASWSGPDMPNGVIIGNVTTLPETVTFTFAGQMQPIIGGGNVYVADMEGYGYCIRADDGTTLYTWEVPGGSIAPPAYVSGIVVFPALGKKIIAYNASTGQLAWQVNTRGPVVSAPCTDGTYVCVGCLGGYVYYINASNGNVVWTSPHLGAQVVCAPAMDSGSVYVGAENMIFYKLSRTNGSVQASKKVSGQSFYDEWPVVYNGKVYIEAAAVAIIGSEYVGEDLMAAATSISDERARWLQFYNGQGGYSDASPDYRHLTVLNTSDFSEPFVVGDGPWEGCGTPPEPPVVDNSGRVLSYFKSKWNYLARNCGFGTNYQVDISAINQNTGERIIIDNGRKADNEWYTWETDNLYGLSVGGSYLFLRQHFRGTHCINLSTSLATVISTQYKSRDGGTWYPDFCYRNNYDTPERTPAPPNQETSVRHAPSISGSCVYITEDFCLTAIEHSP